MGAALPRTSYGMYGCGRHLVDPSVRELFEAQEESVVRTMRFNHQLVAIAKANPRIEYEHHKSRKKDWEDRLFDGVHLLHGQFEDIYFKTIKRAVLKNSGAARR